MSVRKSDPSRRCERSDPRAESVRESRRAITARTMSTLPPWCEWAEAEEETGVSIIRVGESVIRGDKAEKYESGDDRERASEVKAEAA